jgi:hypothetical protein
MSAVAPAIDSLTLTITQDIHVRAGLASVFAALIEQLGPGNETHDGRSMPMVIEPFPGGRWFRDLGDGNGHLWGHVQAIKRPTLLEISGSLFMSYAAVSNVQYRLTEVADGTLLSLRHNALGMIPDDHRDGLGKGWTALLEGVRRRAEGPLA